MRLVEDGLIEEGDSYLSNCEPKILEKLKKNNDLLEEDFSKAWFMQERDSELTYSILDYRPLVF